MAWIESHQALRKHPKTLMAATALSIDRHKLLGHLMCLWWWGLDVADFEGRLPAGTTPAMIADAAEWPLTNADEFVDALLGCKGDDDGAGFVEFSDGRFVLHDWWEYAGKYNAKRAANKSRMREARAVHVQRTTGARAAHVQGLPTNQPNQPTDPTNTPAREVDPDAVDFAGRYVREYERREGKHPPGNHSADCMALVREYGEDACVQVATDLAWAKPPAYMRPILEERRKRVAATRAPSDDIGESPFAGLGVSRS